MRILITGARGQVGAEMVAFCSEIDGIELIALDRQSLNIADHQAVKNSIDYFKPAFVINAAAYTAVDRAESEHGQAFAVNRDGAAYLALACSQFDIPLIHLSTDYIFDGRAKQPYLETDPANPLNVYGKSKWEGEEAIRHYSKKHIILRVSWLFGFHGNNFVKTMLRLAHERKELRVVADQFGAPTAVSNLAEVIFQIVGKIVAGQEHWGTYHYTNQPATNWFEFASIIIAQAKQYKDLKVETIIPITTLDYPTAAQRPEFSVLDCQKIKKNFGIKQGDWQEELNKLLKHF